MAKRFLPIALRPLHLRDLVQVLAIEEESFEHPWRATDFLCVARARRGAVFVAEVRGGRGLVGYCAYELCRRRLRVGNFAVDLECRRRGVGMQMADWLIGKAGETRRRVELEVRESNLAAQLFWRRCGLRAIGIAYPESPQTDESAIVMEYPAKPAPSAAYNAGMSEPITTRGHLGPVGTDYTCLKCRRPLRVIGVCAALEDGREFTSFLAAQAYPGVDRGKNLRVCPYCRHPMPTIPWQRFREDGWPT